MCTTRSFRSIKRKTMNRVICIDFYVNIKNKKAVKEIKNVLYKALKELKNAKLIDNVPRGAVSVWKTC